MTEGELKSQALQLLTKYFELPPGNPAAPVVDNQHRQQVREYLIGLLTPVIKKMLNDSFDQLLNILYRIDLPEKQVVGILEESPPDEIASRLSAAIVDRQLEKISLRERYREPGD